MLPTLTLLRKQLEKNIACKAAQGHEVKGLQIELKNMPDSYDAFAAFARRLSELPFREDWPYVEPNDLNGIWAECDSARPLGKLGNLAPEEEAARAEAAFYGAVAGCILGKPLECNPTLAEVRTAAEAVGEWPLNDYISEGLLDKLGRHHSSRATTTRGNIRFVAPDDDLNYDIINLLVLEQYGIGFTKDNLCDIWSRNLPSQQTWGPERLTVIKAAMHSLGGGPEDPYEEWANVWNPGDELCGAAIRDDGYGYACPGRPALAAELAWRDSSFTHRRTGIYASMMVAAAIAAAPVVDDPLEMFEIALQFVPKRSRFYEIEADCLQMVKESGDWLTAYGKINAKYGQYQHCQLYQEVGLTMNSVKFAKDVGHGICMQVAQGCDTDCFGEIVGSLLGAYFGPGHLEDRWIEPFNDKFYTSLGDFHEQSLSAVAKRMAALPALVEQQLAQQ